MELKYFVFGGVNSDTELGMVSAKSSEEAIKTWIRLNDETLKDAMISHGVKHFPELVTKMEKDMAEVPHDEAFNLVAEYISKGEASLDNDMQTSVTDLVNDFNNISGVLYLTK